MKFIRHLPWFTACVALLLYATNVAPSIVALFDDSLEFQLVGPTFGIAHPTGYPLYILLSGLWSRVIFPFGNWAWRMNLFSAICAAAAIGCLTWFAQQLYAQGVLKNSSRPSAPTVAAAALTAVAAFAFNPIWWSQATIAEVYTLHLLFVTASLCLAMRIKAGHVTPSWLFLCVGLSLAHHRTAVLIMPALFLYLLWSRPALFRPQKAWAFWATALLAPLLLYLYIPLRAATGAVDLHGSYTNTWSGFWHHVLASGYTTFLGDNDLASAKTALEWITLFNGQLGAFALALALLGLVRLLRRSVQEGVLLLVLLLCNLLFAFVYQTPDVEVFTLPVALSLALCVGAASLWIADQVRSWRGVAAHAVQLAILVTVMLGAGGRWPLVDRSQQWDAHDYAVAMAKVDFPPQSRLVGLEGEVTALHYMQQAAELGVAATGVVADDPTQRRQAVAELVSAGFPLYLTRELEGIGSLYSFSADGPLVRVWPRGEVEPMPILQPLNLPFANGDLLLVGANMTMLQEAGGPTLFLALHWQAQVALQQQYKLSLRLLDEQGEVQLQQDRYPLRNVSNTDQWLPGETIQDNHYLRIPNAPAADGAAAPTQLLLILYDAATTNEAGRWQAPLP